jgi:hypothetical protein
VHQFENRLVLMARLRSEAMWSGDTEIERAIIRLVLQRERTLDGLERMLGSGAVVAAKTLAADGVVVRHGERLWCSPCLSRLDELGFVER